MSDKPTAISTYRSLDGGQTIITGGVLYDRSRKNLENLFLKIDVEEMANVYVGEHESFYAEPEFCGKYLDTACELYGTTGDSDVLERARRVVDSMCENQRADGYLGTYRAGLEFDVTFSVWNEQFTIMGLLSFYETTGEERALDAAMRCADYIAENYLKPGGPDLLRSMHQGTQNSCILVEMARLYRITGKQLYLDFCMFIVEQWEASTLKLISLPQGKPFPFSTIGCFKAVEVLLCYRGILELYQIVDDPGYLAATTKYWEVINSWQIGITGNGSIGEFWNYTGGAKVPISSNLLPNENCVAVTWMKLASTLLQLRGESRFGDAMERTLYNHLLGAQAIDGHDFSYYQGTDGHKIHDKNPKLYSCCRYRGMNMLAHLPRHVVMQSDDGFLVNLYCESTTKAEAAGVAVVVTQQTDYPRDGSVRMVVRPEKETTLRVSFRVPSWCTKATATVGGITHSATGEDGFLTIERAWAASGDEVALTLEMKVGHVEGKIDSRIAAAANYGPLVLALDDRYGTPTQGAEIEVSDGEVVLEDDQVGDGESAPIVRFLAAGRSNGRPTKLTLVDYASAGSIAPNQDRFSVWLPVVGK